MDTQPELVRRVDINNGVLFIKMKACLNGDTLGKVCCCTTGASLTASSRSAHRAATSGEDERTCNAFFDGAFCDGAEAEACLERVAAHLSELEAALCDGRAFLGGAE